jgi:hypothetical protein
VRTAFSVLIRKPVDKRPVEKRRHKWEDNIKIGLKDVMCGLDLDGSG